MFAIILGTRPEIIKMSPIIRACETQGVDYFVLHTGQHYSYDMDRAFFEDLELPEPEYNLNVGSGTHAEQTGRIMTGIEKILMKEKPEVVLVQGDTNTVLAGALVASKLHIKVGHIEAGLRSFDRQMPEEINRVVTDHISDYLFAPTETARQNLIKEGIWEERIYVTGNTIVDAIQQNLEIARNKANPLQKMCLTPQEYFLVTAHRAENVDVKERFKGILEGLSIIRNEFSLPVIFSMHPRTAKMLQTFNFSVNGIQVVKPLGYLEFLQLESNARLVLTDSGGLQEEACILGVPCVTLRDNTERPETLEVGANVLAGTDPDKMVNCVKKSLNSSLNWRNPFGDGCAGQRIIRTLEL